MGGAFSARWRWTGLWASRSFKSSQRRKSVTRLAERRLVDLLSGPWRHLVAMILPMVLVTVALTGLFVFMGTVGPLTAWKRVVYVAADRAVIDLQHADGVALSSAALCL